MQGLSSWWAGGLLLALSLPLSAQTWFELDREPSPPGQVSVDETLTEADLDSLKHEGDSRWVLLRVSWNQPRAVAEGAQARSMQAWVEVHCHSLTLRWTNPQFYSERQAQGQPLGLTPEIRGSLQAVDWLPGGGQAKLVKSACGRKLLKGL